MSALCLCSRPPGDSTQPLKALIFDSWFTKYIGAVCNIAVVDGSIKKGMYRSMLNLLIGISRSKQPFLLTMSSVLSAST